MQRRFQKVAVLFGGPSAERDVSLRSGRAVARGLRDAGYDVAEVDITDRSVNLPAGIEAVFIALHGEFGEDGGIQDVLERQGVPYTGSGPAASRAAFDKIESKRRFAQHGIPTPAHEVLGKSGRRSLRLPVVVKPASQGSSIGVHRVFEESAWTQALADALRFDARALVEEYIEGRELTVGVVAGEALPVVQIEAPGDWYSYEAKYTKGQSRYQVPAPIPAPAAAECRAIAVRVFEALGSEGLGRVDIRLTPDARPFVLELNSIPGFTETSLLPMAAASAGLAFPALCGRIMETAAVGKR